MIKNKILLKNDIYFINYFIIKKDRQSLSTSELQGTRTEKILTSKTAPEIFLKDIINWLKKSSVMKK